MKTVRGGTAGNTEGKRVSQLQSEFTARVCGKRKKCESTFLSHSVRCPKNTALFRLPPTPPPHRQDPQNSPSSRANKNGVKIILSVDCFYS
jgi:hypothetical protein